MAEKEYLPDTRPDDFLLYTSEDGQIHVEVKLLDETVWLTLDQMAVLFDKAKSTISEHISNIYQEGELNEADSLRKFGNSEFSTKPTNFYNLDVIISVGYRVKSIRGTQFRKWATSRLHEYIVKGFTMDDERLMRNGQSKYFEELLGRIRNIRSSERVLWEKILDIFAYCSIDYDKNSDAAKEFFATVQNKMHFAAHGHTAAELIVARCDAEQPNMGMTNWIGTQITHAEAKVAKNYLSAEELEILNRIVTAYLEIAELQARMQRAMYMRDWRTNLDNVIMMTGMKVLDNPGSVSHSAMLERVREEYRIFTAKHLNDPGRGEKDFQEFVEKTKRIETEAKKRPGRPKKK